MFVSVEISPGLFVLIKWGLKFSNFSWTLQKKHIKERWEGKLFLQYTQSWKRMKKTEIFVNVEWTWPPKGMNNYSYLYYLLSNDSTFPWSERVSCWTRISMAKWNDATASIGRTPYTHQIKTQFWIRKFILLSLALAPCFNITRTFTNKRKIILHSFCCQI